ncbi:MAG: hypothetical protein HUU06_03595 [Planctomycetaceae bacterium]|nr:hypothetical protein [Planctomycetota bacterium]NUN51860.1 hypothetical protein [Planctomycetaceae bacterium]
MDLSRLLALPLLLAAAAAGTGCVAFSGDTLEERRAYVREIRDEILVEAYEDDPSLRERVEEAPGYVAMNTGVIKILVPGIAKGFGVVVDNRTGKETFLSNWVILAGLGIEVCSRRGLVILETEEALRAVEEGGWDFGAEMSAGLKFGNFGGDLDTTSLGGDTEIIRYFQNGVSLHASLIWVHIGEYESLNRPADPGN